MLVAILLTIEIILLTKYKFQYNQKFPKHSTSKKEEGDLLAAFLPRKFALIINNIETAVNIMVLLGM